MLLGLGLAVGEVAAVVADGVPLSLPDPVLDPPHAAKSATIQRLIVTTTSIRKRFIV
jgi:hypothetical protein